MGVALRRGLGASNTEWKFVVFRWKLGGDTQGAGLKDQCTALGHQHPNSRKSQNSYKKGERRTQGEKY